MKEGQEEEEEGKKTTPMIKHDVNRRALLFLTLQLHWNPQITLMAGHEIWLAAHKMTQTYGDSTCSGMYQHPARACARMRLGACVCACVRLRLFLSSHETEHRRNRRFYFIMCESLTKI